MANPDTKSVGRSIMNFIKTFFDGEGKRLGRKFVNEFVHGLPPLKRRELALQPLAHRVKHSCRLAVRLKRLLKCTTNLWQDGDDCQVRCRF